MQGTTIRFDVTTKGPIFHERVVRHTLKRYSDDVTRQFSNHAVKRIQARLGQVLKHPTGYYQSSVRTELMEGGYEVNDSDVIYGPWLEGTGSRNATTRFKGYHTFRQVTQQLNAEAEAFGNKVATAYIRQLN